MTQSDKEVKNSEALKDDKMNGSLDMTFLKNAPEHKKCIIKSNGQKWFELDESISSELQTEQKIDNADTESDLNSYWLEKIEHYTDKMYVREMEIFINMNSDKNLSSEKAWINMVLKNGTLPDKMSAYSVLLQEDPVHNFASLEALVNMISLKSRRPCMLALDALRDLFCNHLIPKDRKLKAFPAGQKQTLTNLIRNCYSDQEILKKKLILMSFESKLKSTFNRFLEAVDGISKDTVDQTKLKAMKTIFDLLVANPEQESANLARLVNNLGDTTRGIAAKACYQLNKLLEVHPVMKNVVLGEIERLLYRPNVSKRAQYYGICCLSQLMLDGHDEESGTIAAKLIGIYFSFFKLFAVKKGDLDSKLISALLTGVNRAFPYLSAKNNDNQLSSSSLGSHVETMYRVVHMTTNFGTALQALTLLFQLSGGATNANVDKITAESSNAITSPERFYSTLYKKLLDTAAITNSSAKQALFLNLVYKAMKADTEISRSLAYTRRLIQVCAYLPSHLTCSILYLLSEVFRQRLDIKQAFITMLTDPDSTTLSTKLSNDGEGTTTNFEEEDGSSDEEFYKDVKSDDESEKSCNAPTSKSSSWVFKKLTSSKKDSKQANHSQKSGYDPEHRNPLYAIGKEAKLLNLSHDSSQCSWELSELSYQFHPSVQLFVNHLLEENGPTPIKYTGDPLSDFTLIRFLDRFVFRNPKKDPGRGKPKSVFGKRNVYRPIGVKNLAVDGKEYAGISDSSKIPADERFIHTYFRKHCLARTNQADDHPTEDDDNESINSDDFDAAIQSSSKVDLDFASALEADEQSEDENEIAQDSSSEGEEVEGSDSDFEEIDNFDDLSDEVMDSESDEENNTSKKFNVNKKVTKSKEKSNIIGKRKASYDLADLMASAEDYEQLIEDDVANDIDGISGSINEVSNKDKSNTKQLKWESNRRNNDKNTKHKMVPKFNKNRKWANKRFKKNLK